MLKILQMCVCKTCGGEVGIEWFANPKLNLETDYGTEKDIIHVFIACNKCKTKEFISSFFHKGPWTLTLSIVSEHEHDRRISSGYTRKRNLRKDVPR